MHFSKSLILVAAFILGTGGVAFATQAASHSTSAKGTSTAGPKAHEEMGTISSLNSSQLVLSHTVKDKQEETTFKMDSSTKKEGTVEQGSRVAVFYKDQNHERIATEIKAEPKKS